MEVHADVAVADTLPPGSGVRFCDDPPAFLAELDALGVHLTQRARVDARDRALMHVGRDPRFYATHLERAYLGNA